MTITRVKPAGWVIGERLTSAQANLLDAQHATAIDRGGGTHALTAPLVLTSQHVTVNTFETVSDLTVGDDLLVADDVVIGGVTVMNADLLANGPVTLGDAAGDAITINGTVTAAAPVTFNGAVVANAALTANGSVTLGNASGDSITVNGTTGVNAAMSFQAPGRPVKAGAIGANANTTYSPLDYGTVLALPGTLTADRNYSVSGTSNLDGDKMTFVNYSTSFIMTVLDPLGSTLGNVGGPGGFTRPVWIDVERVSGAWYLIRRGEST